MKLVVHIAFVLLIMLMTGCTLLDGGREERRLQALKAAENLGNRIESEARLWRNQYGDCETLVEHWIDMSVAETRLEIVLFAYHGFPEDKQMEQMIDAIQAYQRAFEVVSYACEEDE